MDTKDKKNKNIELENQLKKALADYINLERDMDRRIEMRSIALKTQLAMHLLDVLDASDLAIKSKENIKMEGDAQAWGEGIVAILKQVEKSLELLGITKMNLNVGDTFDSSFHEALSMVPEGEKGKIYAVVNNGYMLGEYVIRPARVIVCNGVA